MLRDVTVSPVSAVAGRSLPQVSVSLSAVDAKLAFWCSSAGAAHAADAAPLGWEAFGLWLALCGAIKYRDVPGMRPVQRIDAFVAELVWKRQCPSTAPPEPARWLPRRRAAPTHAGAPPQPPWRALRLLVQTRSCRPLLCTPQVAELLGEKRVHATVHEAAVLHEARGMALPGESEAQHARWLSVWQGVRLAERVDGFDAHPDWEDRCHVLLQQA